MEAPYILISTISPEKGKKIDAFDKHSKYVVKVLAPTDFSKTLFEYAEYFFEAAHKITEFILYGSRVIGSTKGNFQLRKFSMNKPILI